MELTAVAIDSSEEMSSWTEETGTPLATGKLQLLVLLLHFVTR
jgi:hypothetical protein